MASINAAMIETATSIPTSSTTAPPESEEAIWVEIIRALTRGSDAYKVAFAQLRGSQDPFESTTTIFDALPDDLRHRSQLTLLTWATREAARQEKIEIQEANAVRRYELERMKLIPGMRRETPKKRARTSDDDHICKHPSGCENSGKGRSKGYCSAHGGHSQCKHVSGCEKDAKGKGLCILHGGGKRCEFESGCVKTAQTNGLCCVHGGKRTCQYEGGCDKHIQRKRFCAQHGGGKKCDVLGCGTQAKGRGLCRKHGGSEPNRKS